ncbi:MAG: AAA family ATPase [Desulfobacterales bacterium]|jgi:hypothetical protein|nr:AAA family ATPase [Desulfobacteraceae bacterium]MBT7085980.1 AAA family ATPase [Desulfobacterales bacterium]MBT7698380.1 AAA family ATPase [Desulfobacterales bacterium]
MQKQNLKLHNPFKNMENENGDIISDGGFGAILARAGIGKTSFLVQLAINSMLKEKNVLHISLDDPVKKINLWYREVFNHISEKYELSGINRLWDSILPHRFIQTLKVDGFSVPRLKERITDLTEQNIFTPKMIIIDGMPFDESVKENLDGLKDLANKFSIHVWFTIKTHRHEQPTAGGLPVQLENIHEMFEVAIQLIPENGKIHTKTLIGGEGRSKHPELHIDPSTMLIMEE